MLASAASARSAAAASSGSPAMARKRSISARVVARQLGAGAERRLFEEAVGDLADRAAADRVDAGDRQQIGDQRMRGLRIGAGERRQHALIFRPLVGAAEHQAVEVLRQIGLAVEILDQPPLPGRRADRAPAISAANSADVADADVGRGEAVMRGRFQRRAPASRRRPRPCRRGRRIRCRPAGIRPAASPRWRNTGPR